MKENSFYIKIKKLNIEKHINLLLNKFNIYEIKQEKNTISFIVKNNNKKMLLKYLKNNNIEIICMHKTGVLSRFFCSQNLGVFIAIFLCVFLWVISNFFVSNIVVYSTNSYSVSDIKNIVSSIYPNKYVLKSNIKTSEIEQKIVEKTKINNVSCIIKGSTLIINIDEELTNSKYLEGDFAPIVSLYDGKVTSINVVQGTAVVEVGQIVKLGDTLVKPYIVDASGNIKKVQPIANIVCDIWITARLEVYDQQQVEEKTGRSIKTNSVYSFGQEIYNNNKKIPYTNYIKTESTQNLTNFLLPLKIKTTVYEETQKVVKIIDFESEKENYLQKCRQIAFLGVQSYDIIKDEKQTIQYKDGKHTIICVLTINKKVC